MTQNARLNLTPGVVIAVSSASVVLIVVPRAAHHPGLLSRPPDRTLSRPMAHRGNSGFAFFLEGTGRSVIRSRRGVASAGPRGQRPGSIERVLGSHLRMANLREHLTTLRRTRKHPCSWYPERFGSLMRSTVSKTALEPPHPSRFAGHPLPRGGEGRGPDFTFRSGLSPLPTVRGVECRSSGF